ncbi:acetate kinase [Pelagivirga sediminicola]|uniref:Acetate kinase n=1 Tax=Pelagivirga sediminicola TaxID=2170575 RepID=A0A2T7G8E4_9RHOB|nr:acetate/propionate family kinase [Pelagivirga sediminicola]PVA10695.1 acetate kinase [Pelagivirga sediminicola]
MTGTILVLNVGSSSIKFAAYPVHALQPALQGALTGMGTGKPELEIDTDHGGLFDPAPAPPDLPEEELLAFLLGLLAERLSGIVAVGHRIVHGGRSHTAPVLLTDAIIADLQALVPLAPLHEPHNLHGVAAARRIWPEAAQVGCFDTAFHRTQPEVAQRFAIPGDLHDAGIQRYGFHGLSYQFIAGSLPDHIGSLAAGRVIVAHLGNGASLCAMKEGKSVATTMGMTALDGLVMGTRSGAIDPGAVLHLLDAHAMSSAEVSDLLYTRSGLRGVSGLSGDLRVLEASTDPNAELAQALFAYRAQQEIGALAASLGGLDALVFTAGIGQFSATMRARICEGMGWIGLDLDPGANSRNAIHLQRDDSPVRILALPTDEEIVIFRATRGFISEG